MIKVSTNLNNRLRILRQTMNRIKVHRDNGYKVDKELIADCHEQLTICKQLCRKELMKAPLEELLQ